MAKIECEIDIIMLDDDEGRPIRSVRATCTACGHTAVSFGEGPRSIKRCFALLREECPMGESNWYVAADGMVDKTLDDNPYDDIPF